MKTRCLTIIDILSIASNFVGEPTTEIYVIEFVGISLDRNMPSQDDKYLTTSLI